MSARGTPVTCNLHSVAIDESTIQPKPTWPLQCYIDAMVAVSPTALLVSAALAGIGVVYILRSPPQQADPQFDARVASPAYTADHPRVYFDERWSRRLYEPFLDLIRNDGYLVVRQKGLLTRKALTGFDVLVLTIAMGFKEGVKTLPGLRHHLQGDAFTPEECAIVRNWGDTGGALLLASDYAPTARSADKLARKFGITFLDGWAIEPSAHDTVTGRPGLSSSLAPTGYWSSTRSRVASIGC